MRPTIPMLFALVPLPSKNTIPVFLTTPSWPLWLSSGHILVHRTRQYTISKRPRPYSCKRSVSPCLMRSQGQTPC